MSISERFPIGPNADPVNILIPLFSGLSSAAAEPFLIGVGGAGGCGKSCFSEKLARRLEDARVLPLDDYKTPRVIRVEKGLFGPHPEANHMGLISEHLSMLKMGLCIDKPVYNPRTGRADKTVSMSPAQYIIVDGEISSYPQFRDRLDLLIFIDSGLETQLQTRLTRDTAQRGYSKKKAMATFLGSNLNEFQQYGAPTKTLADIILFCDRNYVLKLQWLSPSIADLLAADDAVGVV